jgi:ubiquinone/menaquinone biosynthesis C-methylase UbiE
VREAERTYVPAAGHNWMLPLYDPLVKLMGGDTARETLLKQARIRSGQRVLDIGCGTGTFALRIKQLYPEADVVGLDPDPKALARANRKAKRAETKIQFDQGFSDKLPYPEAAFDRVFSSFMLHHLHGNEKEGTLREVRRVLKPGGSFHMLDFHKPESNGNGMLTRWLHSSHRLEENAETSVLALMRAAGFRDGWAEEYDFVAHRVLSGISNGIGGQRCRKRSVKIS